MYTCNRNATETNELMPFIYGNTMIHVSQIDHIIPCAYHLPELHSDLPSEVEQAIGRHCASLIADGATLQLGIGIGPISPIGPIRLISSNP